MAQDIIIHLRDLFYTDFELSDIFVMRQKWVKGALFQRPYPRKSTGVIFLNSCEGVYTSVSGKQLTAPPRSIVCLPKGSDYTCFNADCTNTLDDAILVEFNVAKQNTVLTFSDFPFLIKDVNIPIAHDLFRNAIQAFEASVPSPLLIKTSIYTLLSHICKEKVQKHQKRFEPILTGIELIESRPLSAISIEEIAESCNVSSCYFRKLFKEYSGKSPSDYRMELRLNMAKKMLESGESTLEYISEALNFENTSYFCRIFKKKFGITPGEYRKKMSRPEKHKEI